jgi:cytochrome o ubiquinol oxidase subunit 1
MADKRDAFWEFKQAKEKPARHSYEPIHIPKNTAVPLVLAGLAFMFGFCIVWHIYWLAFVSFIGMIIALVVRSLNDKTEFTLPAADVAKVETAISRRYA